MQQHLNSFEQLCLNFSFAECSQVVSSPLPDEYIEWTDVEVEQLHYRVLEDAIETLARKDCSIQKQEILAWIFFEDWTLDWSGVRKHATEIPFSFQSCCQYLGYRPDVLQHEIIKEARKSIEQAGIVLPF